jgi:Domain of unknown function (DUF4168)
LQFLIVRAKGGLMKLVSQCIALIIVLAVSPLLNPVFAQEAPQQDQSKYEPRLNKAQGDQETQVIQKEAGAKIDEALAKEGLSRETYSQIINTLNTDSELRAKAMQLIDEERKKS